MSMGSSLFVYSCIPEGWGACSRKSRQTPEGVDRMKEGKRGDQSTQCRPWGMGRILTGRGELRACLVERWAWANSWGQKSAESECRGLLQREMERQTVIRHTWGGQREALRLWKAKELTAALSERLSWQECRMSREREAAWLADISLGIFYLSSSDLYIIPVQWTECLCPSKIRMLES